MTVDKLTSTQCSQHEKLKIGKTAHAQQSQHFLRQMSRFLFSQTFETKKTISHYFTRLKIGSAVANEPIYDPKHCFSIWKDNVQYRM